MNKALLAMAAALAPAIAWAQVPNSPPIVAEPLPPPTVQTPPPQPAPGQPQQVQPPQPATVQPPHQAQPSAAGSPGLLPPTVQTPGAPGQGGLIPPSVQVPGLTQPQGTGAAQPAPPPAGSAAQPSPSAVSPSGQAGQQPGQPAAPGAPSAVGPPGSQNPASGAPGQPSAPTPAPPPPNVWLPQGGAILQVLDKVNATTATLNVKVGQSATYGSLRVQVLACEIRPPDMPKDAAASLVITDTNPDQPGFHGWMLQNEPFLSMLQSPSYDVRVEGCTP